VQKNLSKYTTSGSGQNTEALNAAIRQIVSSAIVSEGVVDVFQAWSASLGIRNGVGRRALLKIL